MASTILTAIDQDRYTVLDYRALEALSVEDSDNIDLYVLYVEACRNMSRVTGSGCGPLTVPTGNG